MRVIRTVGRVLAVLAAIVLIGRSIAAHHGSASYKTDAVLVLRHVTVTQFLWTNPHSMLLFDAKDQRGSVTHWAGEAGSPAAIRPLGWNKYSLRPGDVVTVEIHPSKFENDVGRVETIVLADGTVLRNSPRTDGGDISRY
jgi:hypothetical protein